MTFKSKQPWKNIGWWWPFKSILNSNYQRLSVSSFVHIYIWSETDWQTDWQTDRRRNRREWSRSIKKYVLFHLSIIILDSLTLTIHTHTHTHTHTPTYIYIYIYIYVCLRVCVWTSVCVHVCLKFYFTPICLFLAEIDAKLLKMQKIHRSTQS